MRISDWSSDVCSSDLKLELAALDKAADHGGRMIDVSGKDRHGGLPGRLSVPAEELLSLVRVYVGMIVDAVKAALAQTSPELSRDILDDGVTLTGGSSAIALLSEGIADATGLCVRTADRPRDCVAVGLSSILDRKSTRLNSSHSCASRLQSSA